MWFLKCRYDMWIIVDKKYNIWDYIKICMDSYRDVLTHKKSRSNQGQNLMQADKYQQLNHTFPEPYMYKDNIFAWKVLRKQHEFYISHDQNQIQNDKISNKLGCRRINTDNVIRQILMHEHNYQQLYHTFFIL